MGGKNVIIPGAHLLLKAVRLMKWLACNETVACCKKQVVKDSNFMMVAVSGGYKIHFFQVSSL